MSSRGARRCCYPSWRRTTSSLTALRAPGLQLGARSSWARCRRPVDMMCARPHRKAAPGGGAARQRRSISGSSRCTWCSAALLLHLRQQLPSAPRPAAARGGPESLWQTCIDVLPPICMLNPTHPGGGRPTSRPADSPAGQHSRPHSARLSQAQPDSSKAHPHSFCLFPECTVMRCAPKCWAGDRLSQCQPPAPSWSCKLQRHTCRLHACANPCAEQGPCCPSLSPAAGYGALVPAAGGWARCAHAAV